MYSFLLTRSILQIICTAVSLLACVPLGELFFFHMILVRKVSCQSANFLHVPISRLIGIVSSPICFLVIIGNYNVRICCGNEGYE